MAYNSEKLLQLLQLCSWKSNSALDNRGFAILANEIDAKIRREGGNANEFVPDQKYLRALQLKLEKNIRISTETGSNARYIQSILAYLNFSDWDAYFSRMVTTEEFIDLNKLDASKYSVARISFFSEKQELEKVKKSVAFAANQIDFPVEFCPVKSEKPEEIFREMQTLMEESLFVVWVVTDALDQQLANYKSDDLLRRNLKSGQVIPVRIGQKWDSLVSRVSFNKALKPPFGEVGLLMAIAAIYKSQNPVKIHEKEKKTPLGGKITIEKFVNNSGGTVAMGDMKQVNNGGNNVLGGNIIQNFPSKEE